MEFVEVTHEDSVALIRLNRPPVNALSESVAVELREAFESVADPSVRAVVVTGRPHFAAGGDIKGFQDTYDEGGEELTGWAIQLAAAALENLAKPTIAAIYGYALGGGLELALGVTFAISPKTPRSVSRRSCSASSRVPEAPCACRVSSAINVRKR